MDDELFFRIGLTERDHIIVSPRRLAILESLNSWDGIVADVAVGGGAFSGKFVFDEAGIGNLLKFKVMFDQTELPAIIRSLDAICAAFPAR